MNTIPVGTTVLCPRCHHKIASVAVVIKQGLPICAEDFRFNGQLPPHGHPAFCPECNEPWVVNQKIFTEYGWRP